MLFLAILAVSLQGFAQIQDLQGNCSLLHEGDLLFFAHTKGNAITDVTQGFDRYAISHVAILHQTRQGFFLLEATHRGVVLTPMDSLAKSCRESRGDLHIFVGRLNDTTNVSRSVARALNYLGRPYDFYFESGDSALYCSELVQISYEDIQGKLIFSPIPMSFHDAQGHITPYWKAYYGKIGKEVPEGAPGSNPGELSRRKELRIRYRLF